MESFIECVRTQPCLWHPLHPEYRRQGPARQEAWQEVVDKLDNREIIPDVQSAKLEWKKLRDNHRDALKRAKLGKNKLLPADITTWKYAKAMQFLEPYMKYRITENIQMEPCVSTTDTSDNLRGDSPDIKRQQIDGDSYQLQDNVDALESFFSCMLKSTKQMPFWMQTQVKKKIFSVIINAEEELSNFRVANDDDSTRDLEVSFESKIKSESIEYCSEPS